MAPRKRLHLDRIKEHHGSQSGPTKHNDEMVGVELADVPVNLQCPICLGIIRKATITECQHRFCKDCVEKSIRLGNHECPVCRTHCPSRRSLREDTDFDSRILQLYPDIEKSEEGELALQSDETMNLETMRQSYNVTLQRQTEALRKKRPKVSFEVRRSPRNLPSSNVRRRSRRINTVEIPESSGIAEERRGLSPIDEEIETIPESGNSSGQILIPEELVITTVEAADAAGQENVPDLVGEIINSSDTITWGRNGLRSNTRTNNVAARTNNVAAKKDRISRLIEHLGNLEVNDAKLDINIKLVSFEEKRVPNFTNSYLGCKPTLSIRHMIQHVASETSLETEELELYIVKECPPDIVRGEGTLDTDNNVYQFLATKEEETLAELVPGNLSYGHLVIAYKKRMWDLNEALPEQNDE